MRRVEEIHPTKIRRKEAEEPTTPEEIAHEISRDLGDLVEVRVPTACDEPILSPSVRKSIFEWMVEQNAADELSAIGVPLRMACLLVGPAGCGKTTLAHHFAARLGMPLVIANGEMIRAAHLGETGRNIFRFFSCLRKYKDSAIGFFDELDAVAAARASTDGQACEKELNAVVTSLLTNIERHDGRFFAATNIGDGLDQAIWRRFGIHIRVELPQFDERFAIIKRYLSPFVVDDATIDELAMLTKGAAPALLRQLCEGMKRAIVLAPRMKRDAADLVAVVTDAASNIAPHPSLDAPRLWDDPTSAQSLAGKPWPPSLGQTP